MSFGEQLAASRDRQRAIQMLEGSQFAPGARLAKREQKRRRRLRECIKSHASGRFYHWADIRDVASILIHGLRPRRWLLDEHPDQPFLPNMRNTFDTPERNTLLHDFVALSFAGTDDPAVAKRRDAQVVVSPVVAFTLDAMPSSEGRVLPGAFWVHQDHTRGDLDLTVDRRSTDVADLARWLSTSGPGASNRHEIWIRDGVPLQLITQLRLKPSARAGTKSEKEAVERLAAALAIEIVDFEPRPSVDTIAQSCGHIRWAVRLLTG